MKTLSDLKPQVMQLPESDRAALAAHLLGSLPGVLADADDGITEALRRDAELERDAGAGISLEELRRSVKL